ncbi:MAG: hypothetical protein M3552_23065 [Planctomycetota bacterium]|nr:hypothetical protein [Planctomycetota bacterium]
MTASFPIPQTFPNVIRPRRILTLAVFVWGAMSAAEANASCGDWLAGHDESTQSAGDGSRNSTPDVPCHGPNCRQNRQDLPIVPTGPSRQLERPERWFWLSEALAAQPPLMTALPVEAAPATIDGFRPSIDRPPRR